MSEAVLLLAYGAPRALDQVEAYYTDIRRGSPPPPHLLENLISRYRAIGGASPLPELVECQREALARDLARRGAGIPVYAGMRHSEPRIGAVVEQMAIEGVTRFVSLPLAPQRSSGTDGYRPAVDAALQKLGPAAPKCVFVESWHDEPRFIEALMETTREAIDRLQDPAHPRVLFSAHSLPVRVVAQGDHYPDEVARTASLVAGRLGLERYDLAFQSAGRTDEPWLGPDLLGELRRLAAEGWCEVIVSPVGFVTSNLEILYDIDVEAHGVALSVGLRLERPRTLDDDPDFIAALADIVGRALAPAAA